MGKNNFTFNVTTHPSGKKTYVGEMRHEGLGKHRIIRDTSENEEFARLLTQLQWFDWEQRYEIKKNNKLAIELRTPLESMSFDEIMRNGAIAMTNDIQGELKQLETLLVGILNIPSIVDWEALKASISPIIEDPPRLPELPNEPKKPSLPERPSQDQRKFQPNLSALDKLLNP